MGWLDSWRKAKLERNYRRSQQITDTLNWNTVGNEMSTMLQIEQESIGRTIKKLEKLLEKK